MNAPTNEAAPTSPSPAWWNLHARLMPDYNAKAAAYWWCVVAAGVGVIGASLLRLADGGSGAAWLHVALCAGLAMLAGMVPVRVPGAKNSFTAGEIFIFVLVLVHGVEAAALACACEAYAGSARTTRRWTSRIASPAMAALSLYASGALMSAARSLLTGAGIAGPALLFSSGILLALAYFVINTLLVTMVPKLKRDEPIDLGGLIRSFGWLGLAYSANAVVATFLYLSYQNIGMVAVVAAAPVIAILLTTGHYFFRRREAEEAVRRARESEVEQARQHVRQLEASEQRFHSAFTHASIGMALVAFDGRLRQVNNALTRLLGLDADDSRIDFNGFVAADGTTTLANLIAQVAAAGTTRFAAELTCRHRDGAELAVAIDGSLFSEPGSTEPCLILQVQDITARKRAESDLHHLAFHDNLTGLPNRHRFYEHLERAIERARLDAGQPYGVLFLDFDRFKLINDSLGHTVGDEFLVKVARRIEESLRGGDVIARLGGDEFAILLQGPEAPATLVALAERLQQTLGRPFAIAGTEVTVSASMGITFSSVGYSRPEEVLQDADIAMYRAKAAGKARYAIFDIGLRQQVASRLRLEGDLRRALATGGLSVDYQPLFELKTRRLIGFEALARWRHPELGTISPATFIPVAEESGSMIPLTDFVLNDACHRLKHWQQVHPQFAKLKVHVNIAGNDVVSPNFVSRIACAVVAARLEPETLSIELTENILMESLESAMDRLNEIHALGVGLSVDDFGTGYSSLAHLSTLPIDSLKIDRSFVEHLVAGSKEAAVIRAIVLLGQSLGKEVIAEGIETERQYAALRELGCDVAQGFLLSRPLAADRIDGLLQDELRQRVVQAERPLLALAG